MEEEANEMEEEEAEGSIISPIWAHIFGHQLDVYIKNLKKEFDKGQELKEQKNRDPMNTK